MRKEPPKLARIASIEIDEQGCNHFVFDGLGENRPRPPKEKEESEFKLWQVKK